MSTNGPSPKLIKPFDQFLRVEVISGVVLLIAAKMALGLANSPWSDWYEQLWNTPVLLGHSPHFFVNELLMSVFFLVVGLEIRREIHDGALSGMKQATLPAAAALGGIIVPAIIYLLFNPDAFRVGWAIPTATDIAFAVGVLALLGDRVSPALRILLLAIAISDDIAAVVVIAIFYANGITAAGLAIALTGVALVLMMIRLPIANVLAYFVPATLVWFGLSYAGLHPALAGVVLGLLAPMTTKGTTLPPAVKLEGILHPWAAFVVMPLFALANAGVSLDGLNLGSDFGTIFYGVALALLAGKPLGIIAAIVLTVSAGWCRLPEGVSWPGVVVIGCLGGIGFTMSIFIASLAFTDPEALSAAKFGVLAASGLSVLAGLILGFSLLPRFRKNRTLANAFR